MGREPQAPARGTIPLAISPRAADGGVTAVGTKPVATPVPGCGPTGKGSVLREIVKLCTKNCNTFHQNYSTLHEKKLAYYIKKLTPCIELEHLKSKLFARSLAISHP